MRPLLNILSCHWEKIFVLYFQGRHLSAGGETYEIIHQNAHGGTVGSDMMHVENQHAVIGFQPDQPGPQQWRCAEIKGDG